MTQRLQVVGCVRATEPAGEDVMHMHGGLTAARPPRLAQQHGTAGGVPLGAIAAPVCRAAGAFQLERVTWTAALDGAELMTAEGLAGT